MVTYLFGSGAVPEGRKSNRSIVYCLRYIIGLHFTNVVVP